MTFVSFREPKSAALAALQPLAIATTQVLWFYTQNIGESEPGDLLRPLALVCGTTLVVWALASATLRDVRRGALFASLLAILFWTSTSIEAAVASSLGDGAAAIVMGGLWIVAPTLLYLWLALATRSLSNLHLVFDVVAAAGLAVPLTSLALADWGGDLGPERSAIGRSADAEAPVDRVARPDIYLIVLDAHGRDDELAEHFGIEEGFGAKLEKLGFYVAWQSRANYSSTMDALPSLLNFDFVSELTDRPNVLRLKQLIRNNRFAEVVRSHGYRFVSYASGLSMAEPKTADVYIEPPDPVKLFGIAFTPSSFERGLLWWTPFDSLIRRSPTVSPYLEHRERIRYVIGDLPRHADDPEPDFVFAHILAPHEPFVFGEHGEDVSPYEVPFDLGRIFRDPDQPRDPGRVGPEYARRYRAQALYIDELVLQAVREILRRSPSLPSSSSREITGPTASAPRYDWRGFRSSTPTTCRAAATAGSTPRSPRSILSGSS